MFKRFTLKRIGIAAVVFCVLFVGGALLYSGHVKREADRNLAETQARVKAHEARQKQQQDTGGTSPVDFGDAAPTLDAEDSSSVSDDTANSSPSETDAETLDGTSPSETDTGAADEPAEEVAVSPYGYGPYPVVPADYPYTPSWIEYEEEPHIYAHLSEDSRKTDELLCRIMIKAWTDGDRDFIGANACDTTGKFYLHFPNTVYIEYGEPYEGEDGTLITPISNYTSGGDVRLTHEQMANGIVPAGVRVLDAEKDSINPYEYLDLR